MKLWRRNPRSISLPVRTGGNTTLVAIDCPCDCGVPFVLPPVAGFVPPEPGASLTQREWRDLLETYSLDQVHRVLNGSNKQCGWDGRIVNGKIYYRDDSSEDDAPFVAKVTETLERIEAREREKREKVRGR